MIKNKLKENLKKLSDIEKFKPNWDGYGSEPFNRNLLTIAKQIINDLPVQPFIFPTGRKSIQMQYELLDSSYLEFEIFEDRICSMIVPKRDYNKAVFAELDVNDVAGVSRVVTDFCKG